LKATARPGTLFALVRSTELGAAPFTGHRNTFTVETFVDNISAGDAQSSLSGLR
jgi:hypothetical protein